MRYTYREFRAECDRVARGLMALGINKGDHVGIWATNYPEWVIAQFATAKIGAVLVTVNPAYRTHELEYLLRQSDAAALMLIGNFRTSDYVAMLNEVVPELAGSSPGQLRSEKLPHLRNVIFIPPYVPAERGMPTRNVRLGRYAGPGRGNQPRRPGATAGGMPPGRRHLHHVHLRDYGQPQGGHAHPPQPGVQRQLRGGEPTFYRRGPALHPRALLPLLRLLHQHPGLRHPGVGYGGALGVLRPGKTLVAVERERCTALHGVPTMFIAQLERPDFDGFDLGSLRTGIMAGSPCPIEVMRQVIDRMGAREMTVGYGLTEASPVITLTSSDDTIERRVTTVGPVIPQVEVKIADPETGSEVPPGEQGELCSRSFMNMKGYYKMPEATAAAIDAEGWLHTGDLATVDADGYYKITGRLKDMIIRGGENVYPREIEEFLYTNPKVADVQVIGVPDQRFGEEIMAWVMLKAEQEATEEEIKEFCRGRIAHYKVPRYVKFVSEFPMTVTGKIQKFVMREMSIQELQLH